MDAVNGSDQKSSTFWGRITTFYCDNHPKRSMGSLNNRWHTLQKAVNKFQRCFAQLETRNSSGTNEKNKIGETKEMFQRIHDGNFAFEHCWKVLRTQPKWMLGNSLSSKKRVYSLCSPAIHDAIDLEDGSTPEKLLEYIERLLGRKAEKKALKKRKGKEKDEDILADWKDCKLKIQENKLKMQEDKMKFFSIEAEKNMMIEIEKIDLENKRLEMEA